MWVNARLFFLFDCKPRLKLGDEAFAASVIAALLIAVTFRAVVLFN